MRERGSDLNENDADELGEDDGEVAKSGEVRCSSSMMMPRTRDAVDDRDVDLVHDSESKDVL